MTVKGIFKTPYEIELEDGSIIFVKHNRFNIYYEQLYFIVLVNSCVTKIILAD